jgi:predicted transcriptional regulator
LTKAKLKARDKSSALTENLLMSIKNLQPKSNRDHILIVSDILSYAVWGIGRTELMFRAGLSSAQIDKYVSKLLKSELLDSYLEKKRLLYRTTSKGKIFLQKSNALYDLIADNLVS